nr:NADPH oxidase 4-like isoform X2 [Cherax quadricarinatus]
MIEFYSYIKRSELIYNHKYRGGKIEVEKKNRNIAMGRFMRICRLLPVMLKRYWFVVAWSAACGGAFYWDYMRYKKQPQYYYTRRMLGLGLCISRGSAAVLNLSCCLVVMPMCRALATTLATYLSCRRPHHRIPTLPATLAAPATHAAKTTHLLLAATVVVSAVVHTGAHLSNAVNFSRHYSSRYPDLNVANYRGESPLRIFVATVPGVTGVAMMVILAVLGVTSTRWARKRNYDVFFYTHHLGLIFLLLLVIHPISGVLKQQKNLHGHIPGCQMYGDSHTNEEGFPEPSFVGNYSTPDHSLMNEEKKDRISYHTLQKSNQNNADHQETYSELEPDFGYPEPDPYNGSPLPNSDSHYTEPDSYNEGYGSDSDNDYIEPIAEYGYPEPIPYNGSPVSDSEYGYAEPGTGYSYTDLDADHSYLQSTSNVNHPSTGLHTRQFSTKETSEAAGKSIVAQGEVKPQKQSKKQNKCLKAPEFGSIHSQTWVWVAVAVTVWAADWAVRLWRRREYVQVLRVVHHPCDVVQLTLRQSGFSCTPGQPPSQHCPDTFTIFMRVRGDWSSHVAALLHPDRNSYSKTLAINCQENYMHQRCSTFPQSSPATRAMPSCQLSSVSHLTLLSPTFPCTNPVFAPLPHGAKTYSYVPSVDEFKNFSFSPGVYETKTANYLQTKPVYHSNLNVRYDISSGSNKVNLNLVNSHRPLLRTDRHSKTSRLRRMHPYSKNMVLLNSKTHRHSKLCNQCMTVDRADETYTEHALNTEPGTRLVDPQHIYKSTFTNTKKSSLSSRKWSLKSESGNLTQDRNYQSILITEASSVRLHVDGPFSSSSENMLNYPVVIGTAGGVGITPLAATLSHILCCKSPWPERIHVVWVVRDARLFLALAPLLSSLLLHCWDAHTEDRLELRLHVTTPTLPGLLEELFAKEHPSLLPRITQGRPPWKHLFREWQQIYTRNKVGVFACGPAKMRHQVKRHCLSSVSRGAPFQYHQESFS